MKTTIYEGEKTVPDLLTFICHEFLKDEESIDPSRLYCAMQLSKQCLQGSGMDFCMLWVNKGPKATEKLPENTVVYLEEGEAL